MGAHCPRIRPRADGVEAIQEEGLGTGCENCGHELKLTSSVEQETLFGWYCHNFHHCGSNELQAGRERWHCYQCGKDFCLACQGRLKDDPNAFAFVDQKNRDHLSHLDSSAAALSRIRSSIPRCVDTPGQLSEDISTKATGSRSKDAVGLNSVPEVISNRSQDYTSYPYASTRGRTRSRPQDVLSLDPHPETTLHPHPAPRYAPFIDAEANADAARNIALFLSQMHPSAETSSTLECNEISALTTPSLLDTTAGSGIQRPAGTCLCPAQGSAYHTNFSRLESLPKEIGDMLSPTKAELDLKLRQIPESPQIVQREAQIDDQYRIRMDHPPLPLHPDISYKRMKPSPLTFSATEEAFTAQHHLRDERPVSPRRMQLAPMEHVPPQPDNVYRRLSSHAPAHDMIDERRVLSPRWGDNGLPPSPTACHPSLLRLDRSVSPPVSRPASRPVSPARHVSPPKIVTLVSPRPQRPYSCVYHDVQECMESLEETVQKLVMDKREDLGLVPGNLCFPAMLIRGQPS
jgi:hypothetical protein